jgi:predicted transposase YbfD/YdcC
MEGFRACFADLVDPRRGNAQRHELDEIVMVALLAMISGAETCVDMALFGRSKEALLRRFLRLPGGIPSHDTFSRVFRLLDPAAFEVCFGRYVAALAERVQGVIAVDGKTARRSFDRQSGQGPLHLISAFACDTRLALGQRKVDGKSNEITALPELLALLTLDGCIVTADAMHCQRATAEAIVARGGDYVLAVKGNQKTLLEDTRLLLDGLESVPDDTAQTVDGDHGRIETRRAAVLHDVAWLAEQHGFPGLAAVGKVEATREIDGKTTTASRYYILSKPLSAARFLDVARTHWHVENRLH